MGLLADIYISDPVAAKKYNEPAAQAEYDRVEWHDLTELDFSSLWSVLQGVPWSQAHMDEFECIFSTSDGERAIFRFPQDMISSLSDLAEDKFNNVAAGWIKEELEKLGCTQEEVERSVSDLARLSRSALTSGKSLYLWNSL